MSKSLKDEKILKKISNGYLKEINHNKENKLLEVEKYLTNLKKI